MIRLSAGGTLRKMCRNTNYVSEEPDEVQALTSSFGIHTVSKISIRFDGAVLALCVPY